MYPHMTKMTLVKHELKQGWKALAVWTGAIGAFIVICVFLYPEMKGEMSEVSQAFGSMGAFSAAFGMDQLNFGTFIGFYAVECGNILGIGGALFASLAGIQTLSKEERDRTAEFLLTHPVSRTRVVTEKLAAVLAQVVILNAAALLLSAGAMAWIGEEIPWKEVSLLHLANFLLQTELSCVCFGISAFLRRGGMGAGMGIAVVLYFLNIIANLSERADALKYITPFSYTEGADIVVCGSLDESLLAAGLLFTIFGVLAAFWRYRKKDILI